jgi:mono/diheme cytochrome c family protein
MKRIQIVIALTVIIAMISFTSCNDKRHPGRVYMPDMAYSRAYEAYAPYDQLQKEGIYYKNYPVEGTIRRGDLFPYTGTNDSAGYELSVNLKDPLPPIDSVSMKEAQRLFLINCAICHGPNMDAQGPIAGKIGAVANLKVKPKLLLPEGQIFHVMTYGKNNMGSYASQLDRKQRWMVVQYIKSEQAKEIGKSAASASTDSTVAKK